MPVLHSAALRPLLSAMLVAGVVSLAACGGGGSSTDTTSASGAAGSASDATSGATSGGPSGSTSGDTSGSGSTMPVATTGPVLSGTAATGAAMDGASIKVYDSTGAEVGSATAGTDGSFTVTLTLGATAPYVLVASRDGDDPLVSVQAEAANGTVNITPVTNLIAATLSPSGDPAKLADEIRAGTATVSTVTLAAKTTEIVAALKPLLDALGASSANPISSTFTANGTGMDRVLDSLKISVLPTASGSNIEITVRQQTAEGAAPNAVQFVSNQAAPALAAVSTTDLLGSGASVLIGDVLKRLTACYALPVTDRITTGGTDAAAIKAPACKSLFSADTPANYLSNGIRVAANGAFSGIYRSGATGVVFDRPVYEFTRANGDIVFSYRWTDSAGNTESDSLVARAEGGALKLIGNQYSYDSSVKPVVQKREFINTPDFDYLSTGYEIYVNNKTDGSGNAIFRRVEVTTPRGNVITLKPSAGLSYLAIVKGDGSLSATSQIRLAAKYLKSTTAGNPADKDGASLVFANPQNTDAEISAFNHQGTWKFSYFLAANTGTVPDSIEMRKTVSRAPTLAELAPVVWPALSDTLVSALKTRSATNGYALFDTVDNTLNELTWAVASGAWAPTSITAYGRAPGATTGTFGNRFNDSASFRTTARTANVECSAQGNTDTHCDATAPKKFATGANMNSLGLNGRNARMVGMTHIYALYKLQ